MKRAASLILLSFFLFNIIGYYFLFLAMDTENRQTMFSSFYTAKTYETLRIHRSEIASMIFKEEGKEIRYKGEMYDVKSRSIEGDYILFTCINDKTEQKLLSGLSEQVQNNAGPVSSGKKENTGSKNPVKDLFFHRDKIEPVLTVDVVFPSAIFHFTSYISPPLPLPPPEASCS